LKHKTFFLILFSLTTTLFASPRYDAIGDIDFSPYSGGEDLLTLHHFLMEREDLLLKRPPFSKSWSHRTARLLDLIAWDIVDTYLMIFQHEVFGHGYRIRDLGDNYAKVRKYKFSWFGAATEFTVTDQMSSSLMTTIAIGGVEATAILANRTRLKWLQTGQMDGRQAVLYTRSQQDLTNYILSMQDCFIEPSLDGHDIRTYLFFLNLTYDGNLTDDTLKKRVLMNYLDPFTFFSYYSWFKYIFSGKPFSFPMIPIGSYRYLPSVRMGLTPFGPEYYLENFLVKDREPIYFYLKWGRYTKNSYFGLGLEQPSLFTWKGCLIGYRFDAWRQPPILFDFKSLEDFDESTNTDLPENLHKQRLGVAFSVVLEKEIKDSGFFLYIQPGFKTQGFLPGESLRAAPIIRAGFSLNF